MGRRKSKKLSSDRPKGGFQIYLDSKSFKGEHPTANEGTLGFYDWQNDFIGVCAPHIWNAVTYGFKKEELKKLKAGKLIVEHIDDMFIDRFCQNIQHEELHRQCWKILGVDNSLKMQLPHTYHELAVRRMMGDYNELHLVNYIATDMYTHMAIPSLKLMFFKDIELMRIKVIAMLFYMFAIQGLVGLTSHMFVPFRIGIGVLLTYYLFFDIKIFNNPFKKKEAKKDD